jgi:hypothetical protein
VCIERFQERGIPTESWGYIDKTGRMVIHARFNTAEDFHGGLAYVEYFEPSRARHVGYIDTAGNFIWERVEPPPPSVVT